jgi:hypothetical protein
MNLIDIAEQLKNAPDQLLVKEVQQPTGNYPAYLVIAEMARRKKMRESMPKEAPRTTVAEDLAAQSRIPQMQVPETPPQRLNAGIMQAPQASQDMAAQDAMAGTPLPKAMAGGGLVAFEKGGEVIRGQDGLFSAPVGSIESSYTTPEEVMAYQPMFPSLGVSNTDYQLKNLGYTREQIAEMNPATKQFIVQRASTTAAPAVAPQAATPATSEQAPAASAAPAAPPLPTFRNPYAAEIGSRLGAIGTGANTLEGFRYSTPREMEAQRVAGTRQFQEENPFLFGFLKEDIEKRQKDVAGRRQSNINEALMEAGLRIAASKSPRFLGAVGEGGLGALKSYKEGVSDIRKAEEAITQSKVQFAQAETLYNQNKFNAGDKKMQQAMDNEKRGLELMSTQQAARVQAISPFIQAAGAEREAFLAPYLAGAYQTQGRSRVDTTPSPTEIKAAKDLAMADLLKDPRVKVGTPEAERFIQERTQFYLMQSGKIYSSPAAQPVNRGTL